MILKPNLSVRPRRVHQRFVRGGLPARNRTDCLLKIDELEAYKARRSSCFSGDGIERRVAAHGTRQAVGFAGRLEGTAMTGRKAHGVVLGGPKLAGTKENASPRRQEPGGA